ncbi:hypothetical protein ADH76_18450 [Enterocloster clostridioformis]|nr:hypothetical protein A4V08_20345 [Lachnoclostridium sp. YL32]NDO30544.1 Tat pathway signal sequence [Enterocloster clostridioformis]OXE66007.1 hypothetical protein ADH76_18450 [Enterocloster clostridioformis]QQR03290.1 DUF5626 family protein [Enterocloster clostridioformis]
MSSKLFRVKRVLATILAMALMITAGSFSAFAASPAPEAKLTGINTITFSNLDSLAVNETMEFDVVDSEGNPAKVGIQRLSDSTRASGTEWKVWYTGVTINAHFYMTVSNNKVTSVYDEWIMILGGTFSDDSLSKSSTYGKLTFTVDAYAGVAAFKCWLKGTVTGSDNDIDVTWQM